VGPETDEFEAVEVEEEEGGAAGDINEGPEASGTPSDVGGEDTTASTSENATRRELEVVEPEAELEEEAEDGMDKGTSNRNTAE